jgi:hypothetical protein
MRKTKVPDYRGELDPERKKRDDKPLPNQRTLFDRSEYVPTKKSQRRSNPS